MPHSTPHSRLGLPSLYLATILLSLNGLFAKLIPLDPVSIIQLRGVIAALGLALFAILQRRSLRLHGLRTCAGVYAFGLVMGLSWICLFLSIQLSTVAVGILSFFSFPVITILLEPLFSGQKLKAGDCVAGAIVIAGLVIMIGPDLGNMQGDIMQGVLWGGCSALLFVLRNLFQKYHFNHVASDSLMFHQVVAVGVMLAIFVDYPQVIALAPVDVLKLFLLSIVCTAGAHTLLIFSMKQLPVKSVALISCAQPVIAVVLAWYLIKEIPALSVVLGGGLVISVTVYESWKKWRTSEK